MEYGTVHRSLKFTNIGKRRNYNYTHTSGIWGFEITNRRKK